MTYREIIRNLRIKYKISQNELGKALKVTRNYINMVENNTGNTSLSVEQAERIINMIYKMGEEKKKENNK